MDNTLADLINIVNQSPNRLPSNIWNHVTGYGKHSEWKSIDIAGKELQSGKAMFKIQSSEDLVCTELLILLFPIHRTTRFELHLENWFANTGSDTLHGAIYSDQNLFSRKCTFNWDENHLRTIMNFHGLVSRNQQLMYFKMYIPHDQYKDPIRLPIQHVDPPSPTEGGSCR